MSSLSNNIVILCWEKPGSSENNARSIAEFMGAEATVVSVAGARDIESIRALIPSCAGLVVHADILVRLTEVLDAGVNGLLFVTDLAPGVFIHGFDSTERHAAILQVLSSGGLLGAEALPPAAAAFRVADGHREWVGQFSGVSVGAVSATTDGCFVEGVPQAGQDVLVRVSDRPFFVRAAIGGAEVFFVACRELGNLDEKVPAKAGLLPWFSRLAPLMMFLRRTLGNYTWHGESPQACIIIDDLLLKPRHGFVEYSRLLHTMSQHRFSTCIAFIPWNYRRSRKRIAEMFSDTSGSLSICVHGCDHTGAEFAAPGFELLRDKARLALDRMNTHGQLSGVSFNDVMVFPQGRYSPQAIEALDACGYLAAVNTDLHPLNTPRGLTLRDFLEVAVTKFADFPVFGRHYPRDPAEFAFDLFLGKPVLVVEHHGYFRDGYEAIGTFVKQLHHLDERLVWGDLATICSGACLRRVTPNGDIHVRFYTNRFRLINRETQTQAYVLFRRRTSKGPLPRVTVNGGPWACDQENDQLKLSLSLGAGQTAGIRILPEGPAGAVAFSWKRTETYKAKVLVRRVLCEFRDNYVDTNPLLAGLLSSARKLKARKRRPA